MSYYIPATITRVKTSSLDIEIVGVYVDFVVDDEHPNGYISGVYPIDFNGAFDFVFFYFVSPRIRSFTSVSRSGIS